MLNGPNLNLLGVRSLDKYGNCTLDEIVSNCSKLSNKNGFTLKSLQSNSETELINWIQLSLDDETEGLIINPGAYGHTSWFIETLFLQLVCRLSKFTSLIFFLERNFVVGLYCPILRLELFQGSVPTHTL